MYMDLEIGIQAWHLAFSINGGSLIAIAVAAAVASAVKSVCRCYVEDAVLAKLRNHLAEEIE